MKQHRSASQIQFGFLPDQTVDIGGGIWKVKEWIHPSYRSIDTRSLTEELIRAASPWAAADLDGKFVARIRSGREVKILELNIQNGVRVDPFPRIWMCRRCKRISSSVNHPCECGVNLWGQLPFVGFHPKCGGIFEPYIKRCPEHRQVKINQPETARVEDLVFSCPVCGKVLKKGLFGAKCRCGKGDEKGQRLEFNVHRSSTVFTPRTMVMVNPPSRGKMEIFTSAGGRPRALDWVLGGMEEHNIEDTPPTEDSLRSELLARGLPEDVVNKMIDQADGHLETSATLDDVSDESRQEAERESSSIALAFLDSRVSLDDLKETAEQQSERGVLYNVRYPASIDDAGLERVDLTEKFPVLTATFGYTRGGAAPGESFLKTYRDRHGHYLVYGNLAETEALYFGLNPVIVAHWLQARGHEIDPSSGPRATRVQIIERATIPAPAEPTPETTFGTDLLTLIHSYAHRVIRKTAAVAGIEMNTLAEYLVPLHCGFFIYAAARGNFVLGGLQAVLETDLHTLLHEIVHSDHRCPMDPGCKKSGGACMACLHVGEPSCRYFNRYLNRSTLWGNKGYFALAGDHSA